MAGVKGRLWGDSVESGDKTFNSSGDVKKAVFVEDSKKLDFG